MFCLRSWLPLLFIPTSASPAFIILFLLSTYLFHRPWYVPLDPFLPALDRKSVV